MLNFTSVMRASAPCARQAAQREFQRPQKFAFNAWTQCLLALMLMACWPQDASARSSVGYSGRTNLDGGLGCASSACHSNQAQDGAGMSVVISGPSSVGALSSGVFTVTATKAALGSGDKMGMDVASNAGTLSETAANLTTVGGDVVHTQTGGTLDTTNASGSASYNFTLTPGGVSAAGTTITLYAVARLGLSGGWKHAANLAVPIPKLNQTITFPAQTTSARTYVPGGTFSISPQASASSGLSITYTSDTTSVCTTPGTTSTTVTMQGGGTCTIRANQNGNSNYNAAVDAVRSITINKATQATLTALLGGTSTPTAMTYLGATRILSTSGGSGAGAVTYATSNAAVCFLSGTTLTPAGAGSCTITATKAADTDYLLTSDTLSVTVNKANQAALTTNVTSTSLVFGGSATLSATGGSNAGALSYVSSNTNCTIVSTTLNATGAGTCIVTGTRAADVNYNAVSDDTPTITVSATVPGAPTGASASPGDASATVTFSAPANTGGSAISGYTVTSSPAGGVDSNAGTSSLSHIVTSLTNGVAYTFTVRANNGVGTSAASAASNSVTPSATPVAPTITSANATTFTVLTAGSTFTVTASGTPSPTVSLFAGTLPTGMTFAGGTGSGLLAGTPASGQAGTRTLTFRASNASGIVNQSFTLTVGKLTQIINFTPPLTQEFSPTPIPISATATLAPVTFFTTEPTICDVVGATFTTLQLGNCTLIAQQAGNADYNPIDSGKKFVDIIQGTQTITFGSQPSPRAFIAGGTFSLNPVATASSGFAIEYGTASLGVCAVNDPATPTVTMVGTGVCSVRAKQPGDINYAAADPVTVDITISPASQTITWGAQSNQAFGSGGTFAINPLATGGASGLPIVYGPVTSSVCTVSGNTVTKISTGICTLSANQDGNANYAAAAEVQRSLTISASLPSAPTATLITPSDSQVVIAFDPPSSNGGSAITGYRATCNPGGVFANGTTSPITVTGLTNNTAYTCAVVAQNAAGSSAASNALMATPTLQSGVNLWTNACTACHVGDPSGVRFNAAGTTATVLSYVITNQATMAGTPTLTALTPAERAAIADYIRGFVPLNAQQTPFNTPKPISVAGHITLDTVSFTAVEAVTLPANGTLSAFTGTSVTYTPNPGFVGVDGFTYRGKRTSPTALNGDPRAIVIQVQAPPAPVITSPATANGTFGVPFNYQITASNSPTSFAATGLGANLSINNMTGLISGTPNATGTFNVTITATNAGGSDSIALVATISPASQTITFGAQAGQSFSPGGIFMINPLATTTSPLAITHSSLSTGVCTVSGSTVTIVTAGICTLAANQAGNANYNAALEVTRAVNIAAAIPGAPVIGVATAGDSQASIAFTPPANNGGSVITSYTVTCVAAGRTTRMGSASTSPVIVLQLDNTFAYSCTVIATNGVGAGPASGAASVTPSTALVAPLFTSANATTFTVLSPGAFTVTATGTLAPTLSMTGTLPAGVTFTPGTGALAGTPSSGTANTYPLNFTATNASGMPSQSFTLTIAKANQTITFVNPGTQNFSAAPFAISASATSSLTVAFTTNTPGVCTVLGGNVSMLATGVCSISANQPGDADYNAASQVTRGFTISAGGNVITFGAQSSPRNFATSAFGINPLATATSGLAVTYNPLTSGVCTVSGSNVTPVTAGTCMIAANQAGNANFAAAAQVSQSILINGTVPGAPTIGAASAGSTQATINFTPPINSGGSAITLYTASCNGVAATGTTSPIVVSGLVNGTAYMCSVTATNATGTSAASSTVTVTPLSGQGSALWLSTCDVCHTSIPAGNQFNAAGTTGTVLNYVRATQLSMVNNPAVQALSSADLDDIAAYIASELPEVPVTTTVNVGVDIDVGSQITLNTISFTSAEAVTNPTNGVLSVFAGTVVTYTPNPGFIGTDTFTYRGKRTSPASVIGDVRTITIDVQPVLPVITSATSANGTFGVAFSYQITADNSPTSFDASGLPPGLTVNTVSGLISGVPTSGGSFVSNISAINSGGAGNATLGILVNTQSQTITFGAQASPRAFVQGGTFAVNPPATGGASGNAVTYSANTTSVCTVSGLTVSIVASGVCTINANQAGDTNYSAAPQVSRDVIVTAISPGAPIIGSATAGNAQATISFSAPTSNGGSPITNYTATCTPSGAGSANASPIVVSGLTNGQTYTCSVTAMSAGGISAPSASVTVTPVSAVVPPGAPTIGIATPGNTQATIAFTPPLADGGSAITSYTASCNPGNITASNIASPITVVGLTNGTAYTCSVSASNAVGTGPSSAGVAVTPLPPLALVSVLSRKTHGAAGDFDLTIDSAVLIGGAVTTESRGIGLGHTLVFQFNNPVTAAGSVSVIDSAAMPVGVATLSNAANNVVVTLTGIADNKRVTVTLTNVNGVVTPFSASIGFLVGDVNGTRSVNSSDISGVKARSGQPTDALNFKFDVNASGAVNSSDVSAVKARSGLTLAP